MSETLVAAQDAIKEAVEGVLTANLSETENPFSLQPEHEFKAPEPPPPVVAAGLAELPEDEEDLPELAPAMPGTPESDYRKCPCIGVMPGRACMRCHNSKWVKTCPKCNGEMCVKVHSRKGAHARTERCGFCIGLGQVAARLEEVRAAEEAAKAYKAPTASARAIVPRGPQLPGVGMTPAERKAAKAAAVKAKNLRRRRGR